MQNPPIDDCAGTGNDLRGSERVNANICGNNNLGKFRKIIVAEMSRREGECKRRGWRGVKM